jgi:hypothetical protein
MARRQPQGLTKKSQNNPMQSRRHRLARLMFQEKWVLESQIVPPPSFETATEPVIGRAFARPVGGLLGRRSNLLKHNSLMLRSEQRERLEAWAASEPPISHSLY